ncbi:VOC family protein [Phytoactinopolyspora halotolerans]|uniref:VOC family protein n=1 Tax=Phytoactinopolyspora halotolerans TaxID=1981512 RepID=A0A6L9SAT1_9ACTN|nr:VOC family protein [Phytoactinopolyspora halotolerans]NEE01681.1 VOC family protein [Phytoactinopolyspora halotolerans]
MRLSHLGLPVSDVLRSQGFYASYFGFDPDTATRFEDDTVIIRNADGFDLAFHPVARVDPQPEFLHFGFRLASAEEVRGVRERLEADGSTIIDRWDEPAYVGFKVLDPDGHRVEVYWEPPQAGQL